MKLEVQSEIDLGDLGTHPATVTGSVERWGSPVAENEEHPAKFPYVRATIWFVQVKGLCGVSTGTFDIHPNALRPAAKVSFCEALEKRFIELGN